MFEISENPYLLLTPGPLSTTPTVKSVMMCDWCTWDDDYNSLVRQMRTDLVRLGTSRPEEYTCVPMQGSGTFAVESVIGSVIPRENAKLLVMSNGAYGERIARIAGVLGIPFTEERCEETRPCDAAILEELLKLDKTVTHVAVVHCETTTGILNDVKAIGAVAKKHKKTFIVDAMSSFGGIPLDMEEIGIDFLVSSANKCIQGVPGFGFALARRSKLELCREMARSLSLDLYDQWIEMEKGNEKNGKWRFTSPTHVVRAFIQALQELDEEGGVAARNRRYRDNQRTLSAGMKELGFEPLLDASVQSPIITSFLYPKGCDFSFMEFYEAVKTEGYVLYPGKISKAETFRIGNIGDVHLKDIEGLLLAVKKYLGR
ncbi:MAG: 2-aminoethylphosphonate--pyruvate transaminase [Candidatus Adiutrix sp.]|jgi:2-aminoethylphosphonate-pyruvate transaminase|nr:2-aminoethylphosphonate--pyruvate transaminase [Candidatus Adiutrix sp.]